MTATAQRTFATRARVPALRFDQRLVLNRYLLGLFGVESLEAIADGLKDPLFEGWDEENVSQFHHVLAARFPRLTELDPPGPSRDDLLRYDGNIYRHTEAISHSRPERIRWKYFQYLALLFAEVYLDRYFRNSNQLLAELNASVAGFNANLAAKDQVAPYKLGDLRKLAFWMATGAGKTLLMHVNVLQYRHYLAAYDRLGELNRTILLTPNEGLSKQHLAEFAQSGIAAERFDKAGGRLFTSSAIQVLEVTKLAEDMGKETVAVDAFEGNNLVLVDEGHRGAGGEDWKDKRDRLAAQGFSFEYSATFGQAMKAARKEPLTQEYARCILFDYSYRYFYGDGYGKDYQILNLAEGATDETEHLYLAASLLAFYQQQLLYADRAAAFALYGLERPLWVFVGSSVIGGLGKTEGSDVLSILRFVARFVSEREESVTLLDRLVSGNTGLVAGGRDVFANKFPYLAEQRLDGEALYAGILRRFCNAGHPAQLRVEELKGVDGELALRLGDHQPFGVVNVGDARALARLCESEPTLVVSSRELSSSLFSDLNTTSSSVHLLIGAKKFTEGWNSYRVSSLGLMNVGRGEGAQIIQLFGRGVRLRGFGGGLQRSTALRETRQPERISLLETLNVYGLRADYMQRFKEYLEEEGLPPNEGLQEIILPVLRTLPDRPLKSIRVRDGGDFKRDAPRPTLGPPPDDFVKRPIPLDYYPKLQALESAGVKGQALSSNAHEGKLGPEHLAFMDLEAAYFELVRHKNERGWHNLALDRKQLAELLADDRWYKLTIPAAALGFDDPQPLRRVRLWEEIAAALLKKYAERYYKMRREAFEAPLREYYVLDASDTNFIDFYRFQVAEAHATLLVKLKQVKEEIEAGSFKGLQFPPLDVFAFGQHLYRPLVHLSNKDLEVKPVALNQGERDFVVDLKAHYEANPEFFVDKELYLLRNLTRGKGIGFFEAGNFYPDFILWLLVGDHQYVTFIDPKGIVRLERADDPKIVFHRTIKEIEIALGDPDVTLNSFIVSNTRYADVATWGYSKEELRGHHVLFQQDDRATYIGRMLDMIVALP